MFATLILLPCRKGLLGIKDLFLEPRPLMHRIQNGGINFYSIEVIARKNKAVDIMSVINLAKKNKIRNILLSKDFSKESFVNSPLYVYNPQYFVEKLFIKSICDLVKYCGIPISELKVAIIDLDANNSACPLASILVPLTSILKIITKKSENFEKLQNNIMNDFGSAIILTDDYNSLSDCQIIVAPYGVDNVDTKHIPKTSIVISAKKINNIGINAIDSITPKLPFSVNMHLPKGISPLDFSGALYEFCGIKELQNVPTTLITSSGEQTDLLSLIKNIR